MSELTKRIISGVILGTLLLGDLWLGSWWYLALLFVGGLVVLYEFSRLVLKFAKGPIRRGLWLIFGLLYVGFAIDGLWRVRSDAIQGLFWALWLFLVVWGTDIGAYVFGRLIGGPKIAPKISPSKTWAGLVGAIFVVAVLMNVMFYRFATEAKISGQHVIILGLFWGAPLAILAQAGDFFQSWMKRRAGVKDSGALIPGHGGLFDRVDGLLPVALVFHPWVINGLFD